MPLRRDGMAGTAMSGNVRPRPGHQARAIIGRACRFAPCLLLCQRALAAAADALDLLVEGGVFLAERVVRIAQVFFVRHVADTRLTMTDRRLSRRLVRIFRDARRSALRERGGFAEQYQQRYRQDRYYHLG